MLHLRAREVALGRKIVQHDSLVNATSDAVLTNWG